MLFADLDLETSYVVDNTFPLVLPDQDESPLRQILDLVRRSDSIATKSEGTRVLVNAVKSLWSTDPKTLDEEQAKTRETAMEVIVAEPYVSALARLIGRSKRYPTLINEGVVALSLISTHPNGGIPTLRSYPCRHAASNTDAHFALCCRHVGTRLLA